MKFPETNSDNVLSMVNFLKQELQEHHIEFFRFGDDVKNSGLVNHAPLTLLASCILGAHANHLPTFIEKYKQVLKDFKCALVPPIPSTNTLSDLLSQNEVIDKCRNNPEYTVSLRDYFFTQIKKKGLKNTIQQVLPVAVVKGCFLAKFFHAILLCIFPVHLYEVISECGDSILKQGEDSMYHLSASGLALLFTTPDPLHILEFNENLDSGIKSVPSKDQISENINSFMNSDAWKNWYSAAETEIAKPFYLFGITSYFEYFSKDETKPCQKLFEEYLDIDAQLIKNNREQVICSLAEYVLEYYAEGQGFLALHIVSATCALVILSSFIEDDEDFALISRKLWYFIAFAMISSIEAAKREGITGVTRARGERSTPVEESEWEAADKDWNSLIRNALNTECAHSIKLVYAVRTIWNFIETNNRQTEECENTAKYCAFVATCYRIP